MENAEFEHVMEVIRGHVAKAVENTGKGLKPFAKENGMGETVVRDLVKAMNKDVQLGTLAKIAKGAAVPLADLIRMPSAVANDETFDIAGFNERTLAPIVYEILLAGKRSRAPNPEPLASGLSDYLQRLASDPAILNDEDALKAAAHAAIFPDTASKPPA